MFIVDDVRDSQLWIGARNCKSPPSPPSPLPRPPSALFASPRAPGSDCHLGVHHGGKDHLFSLTSILTESSSKAATPGAYYSKDYSWHAAVALRSGFSPCPPMSHTQFSPSGKRWRFCNLTSHNLYPSQTCCTAPRTSARPSTYWQGFRLELNLRGRFGIADRLYCLSKLQKLRKYRNAQLFRSYG